MSPEEIADRFAAEAEDRAAHAADVLEEAHRTGRCQPCVLGNHSGSNGTPGCEGGSCRCSCHPAAPPDHSGYRFTPEDEARIRASLAEYASNLPADWNGQARLGGDGIAARQAASSIGCGLHDLREVEVAWIFTEARRALVGIPALEKTLAEANARLAAARDSDALGSTIERQRASHAQTTALARLRAARILIGEIDGSES